jgi:membrane protease YdiL (CAAX protease family)
MNNLRDKLKNNKIYKIIEIISVFAVALIFIKIFIKADGDNLLYNQGIIWVANIIMLSMVWGGLKIRGESWQDFGLSFKKITIKNALNTFLLSILVFVIAMVGFVFGSIIMANITGIPEGADFSSYDYLKDNVGMLILTLCGVYIVSSFGEEVIYRAFLINRISEFGLTNKTGKILAVTLSAVIFGFAHYSWGPMGIVQTGFMGIALGFCYIAFKKRLWILIIAHAYMDTILVVQMYLASN